MRKAGPAFGPKPRMIIMRPILILGELGVVFTESSHIRFNVTSTFNQTGPVVFRVILTVCFFTNLS